MTSEMQTFLLTATYLIGLTELAFGLYFWKTNAGNQTRKVAGTLALSMSAWVLLNALTAYRNPSAFTDLALPFIYLSVIVFMIAMVHLALLFPIPLVRLDRLHVFLLYLPVAFFIQPVFGTQTIVQGYVVNPTISGYAIPGPLYPLFTTFVLTALLAAIILFIRQIVRTGGELRKKAITVFLSLSIPVIGGVGYNIPHELRGVEYNSLVVPFLTSVWVALTSVIVLRK